MIADYSDNPGAGSYGDATNLLKALLEAGVQEACFGAVCDPDAVKSIVDAGVGSNIEVEVGGKNNPELWGGPLRLKGKVMGIFNGDYLSEGPMYSGFERALVRLQFFT